MKSTWKAQSIIEWIGQKANRVPIPTGAILYSFLGKSIFLAFKFDLFRTCKDSWSAWLCPVQRHVDI